MERRGNVEDTGGGDDDNKDGMEADAEASEGDAEVSVTRQGRRVGRLVPMADRDRYRRRGYGRLESALKVDPVMPKASWWQSVGREMQMRRMHF